MKYTYRSCIQNIYLNSFSRLRCMKPMAAPDAVRAKLHGHDFLRSIGNPRTIVAPMVDQSELAFRLLCRRYGAQLAYSPMINAGLVSGNPALLSRYFTTCAEDRPLFGQLCGHDPDAMLAVGRMIENEVDAVDVNLGCPQQIARRGHYGAFLLEDTPGLLAVVSTLARGLKVPVTCKIRLLPRADDPSGMAPDVPRTLALVEQLQAAGAALVTIHGRTRHNMKNTITAVDWDAIRTIKAAPTVRIPVFANGGIGSAADVAACLAYTGVDGVMSSEALLENPGLFSDNVPTAAGPAQQQQQPQQRSNAFDLALEYLDLAEAHATGSPPSIVRAHLLKMLFGALQRWTDLRDALTGQAPTGGSGLGGDREHAMQDLPSMRRLVLQLYGRYKAERAATATATAAAAGAAAEAEAARVAAVFASARPTDALSPPAYLTDVAAPGLHYMRYRAHVYAPGGARPLRGGNTVRSEEERLKVIAAREERKAAKRRRAEAEAEAGARHDNDNDIDRGNVTAQEQGQGQAAHDGALAAKVARSDDCFNGACADAPSSVINETLTATTPPLGT
jgi:tRNA-dihydrouridine synthase 1